MGDSKSIKVFEDRIRDTPIEVKVVKMSEDNWWYEHMVGKIFDVVPATYSSDDYYCDGNGDDNCAGLLLRADCEIVYAHTLQEQLQEAKNNVEAIEKLLAEEANKPFSREDYERVVAQYRGCGGRIKVDLDSNSSKYCFTIANGRVYEDAWCICTLLPFGVAFGEECFAKSAIEEVGADNLLKAWQFEMSIGMVEDK